MIWQDGLACALAAALLLALGLGPQHEDLVLREAHHGYTGMVLYAAARLLAWSWLGWVGILLIADDAAQHAVQRWGRWPAYRSPIHRAYGLLYAIPWVRRLNVWLDARLK